MIETLQCQAGHSFTRTAVRGKKPAWCPEHRALAKRPAEAVSEPQSAPQTEEPEPKREKPVYSATTIRNMVAEVQEVLDHPQVEDGLKDKLRYTIRELQSGRRDNKDMAGLNRTRQIFMNDARRQMHRQVVEIS